MIHANLRSRSFVLHIAVFTTLFLLCLSSSDAPSRTSALQVDYGTTVVPEQFAVVNMSELAAREEAASKDALTYKLPHRHLPGPADRPLPEGMHYTIAVNEQAAAEPAKVDQPTSPSASASFIALEDNNTSIPPDTHGAVGPSHLMVTLNTQVRIQSRTGTTISTVSLDSFWANLGNPNAFDPKVLYDPFSNRWIFTCVANAQGPNSATLLAVSQTGDPTQNWHLFKTDADSADTVWADYPSMGFNKDWIAVQVNMFTVANDTYSRSHIYVFNKSAVYAGSQTPAKLFQDNQGFAQVPATTFDNTLTTLFLVENWNGNSNNQGFLRASTITGAVGSEAYTTNMFVATQNTWRSSSGSSADFAPQLGSTSKIDAGDARFQTLMYRSGSLWGTHTVFLPATAVARSAIQWWEINATTLQVTQIGRIDDSTGQMFYGYPSLAVNKNKDVLIGYSRFSATQLASAYYSFRLGTEPANTLQSESLLKSGEAPYFKTFGGSSNRWGDYSHTVVDPANDTDMWTIQEYAATPSGGFDRWGTWWGMVSPSGTTTASPSLIITMSKATYVVGDTITATEFRVRNPGTTASTVRLRSWLKVPTFGEVTLIDVGSDGTFAIPTNIDVNIGPLSLITVSSTFPPAGSWEFNSRMTNPATGSLVSEDINPFTVSTGGTGGFDGTWRGTLPNGRPVEFDVSNNAVTRLKLGFVVTGTSSTCSKDITFTAATGNFLTTISNNSFTYNFRPTGLSTTVTVNFTSTSQASGNYGTVTLTNFTCGTVTANGTQTGASFTVTK